MKRTRWLLLLLFAGLLVLLYVRVVPAVRALTKTCVGNRASQAINDAVNDQIAAEQVQYDKIVLLEKDTQGRITAIRTNMAEINRLKTGILDAVDDEIMELSVSEIGLPLGNLFLPELFSGKGPRLPVRVLSVSSSDAEFSSEFTEAGINQTLHRIMLQVTVTMTILTPVGTQSVSAQSQVIAAETAIIGTVPNTYMNHTLQRRSANESAAGNSENLQGAGAS